MQSESTDDGKILLKRVLWLFNQLKIQVVKAEMSCNYNWCWNSLIGLNKCVQTEKHFQIRGNVYFLILRIRQMLRVHLPSILMNYWIKSTNTFNIFNHKNGNFKYLMFLFLPSLYNLYVGKLNLCEKLIESIKDEEFIVLLSNVK